MKRPKTWFLVADAGSARLIREMHADRESTDALDDLIFEHDERPTREIMSDRPGRSFASVGRRRSSMEYRSDPVRERNREFARTLSEELESHLAHHAFDRLMIAAEPRMLGLLREEMSAAVRERVAGEIPKDLVKLPREKLLEKLREAR